MIKHEINGLILGMNAFNLWNEKYARSVRWILLAGWIFLIVSLFFPGFAGFTEFLYPKVCVAFSFCEVGGGGANIFWNYALPFVLVAVLLSHELWRRICPLSQVSQIARYLGLQRTIVGKNGKKKLAAVEQNSWLANHHTELQWFLLISGLSLRVLLINSNRIGLAIVFITVIIAALITGWAFSGKAWCQYICPFGTVQKVISGPGSILASKAHLDSPTRVTQSMCRDSSPDPLKPDVSTCVACTRSCIDIDSERSYWDSLTGKRGLNWAWYSYPGLVISFFSLVFLTAPQNFSNNILDADYITSHVYTYDGRLPLIAWESWLPEGYPYFPRIIGVPLILAASAIFSQKVFRSLESFLNTKYSAKNDIEPRLKAIHHTRLIATFVAINGYFLSKGAFIGDGSRAAAFSDVLVMAVLAFWIARNWRRDHELYRRESTVTSLRNQLLKLSPELLTSLLAGRRLQDLNPDEVFILAKALPQQSKYEKIQIYRNVLLDLVSKGLTERKESLVHLEELRSILGLDDADHSASLSILDSEDNHLSELNASELSGRDLKLDVAKEKMEVFLESYGFQSLDVSALSSSQSNQLDDIRFSCSLNDEEWQFLQSLYKCSLERSAIRLEYLLDRIKCLIQIRIELLMLSKNKKLLLPLVGSLDASVARLLPDVVDLQIFLLAKDEDHQINQDFKSIYKAIPASSRLLARNRRDIEGLLVQWSQDGLDLDFPLRNEVNAILASLKNMNVDANICGWVDFILGSSSLELNPFVKSILQNEGAKDLISSIDIPTLMSLPRFSRLKDFSSDESFELGKDEIALVLKKQTEPSESFPLDGDYHPLALIGLHRFLNPISDNPNSSLIALAEDDLSAIIFNFADFELFLESAPLLRHRFLRGLMVTA